MADMKKLYKQLKRYDNEDRTDFDEKTGKLEVYGDHLSAEAVDRGNVIDINIHYEEDEYTSMYEDAHMIENNKTAFGILAGVLDGCLIPELDDTDNKLLYLKKNPQTDSKRMITGGAIALMISGVALLLISAAIITFFIAAKVEGDKISGGIIALFSFVDIILIFCGIILVWNSIRATEIKFTTYLFSRVDRMPDEATIKRIFQAVCEKTRTDALKIKLDTNRVPGLTESKIGGVPYWDMTKPYPVNDSGEKMIMLAQFNLSELPENDKLPRKGMLQFFVLPDASYGRYFDGSNDGHKVIYHSTVDKSLTEEQVWSLGISTSLEAECFPVSGEFALNFEKIRVFMSPEDGRINDVVQDAANRMGIYSETYDALTLFSEEQIEGLRKQGIIHGLFGYPCFIQWDPRGKKESEKYDVLLFQLGSEWKDTNSELYPGRKIMWGDEGICQFFINSFALSRLDFSDVLYNWECS